MHFKCNAYTMHVWIIHLQYSQICQCDSYILKMKKKVYNRNRNITELTVFNHIYTWGKFVSIFCQKYSCKYLFSSSWKLLHQIIWWCNSISWHIYREGSCKMDAIVNLLVSFMCLKCLIDWRHLCLNKFHIEHSWFSLALYCFWQNLS